jgi:pSer/pThr/pTyr-binding forkhead associated (FHA) protein
MEVALVMFKADGARRDFAVSKERIVIGRTSHCDLRIPLSSVSRQHCELRVNHDSVHLRDLGSSNGTYHNSIRVQGEAELKAGDEIVIGPVVFTVVINGEPARIEPVHSVVGEAGHGEETLVQASPQKPLAPAEPEVMATVDEDDDEIPAEIEPQEVSPTVDMDDPIAALQAMADSESQDDDLPLLIEDDDEDEPPAKPSPRKK